jgi:protein-tyrosine phosphatase
LVLTAAVEHRAAVLRAEPSLLSKAFTLREFARLASAVQLSLPDRIPTGDELRLQVAAIASRRGFSGPAGPAENDIVDPYGASFEVARATVLEISGVVNAALAGLGLRQTGGTHPHDWPVNST